MNFNPIEEDAVGVGKGQVIDFEEVIPAHLREELLTMRVVENRSAWRTGDIALEIIRSVEERGLKITKGAICRAVAYYRGLSPGRVHNIVFVCRHFPPEKREFAKPFTYYERAIVYLKDKATDGLQLVEKNDSIIPAKMIEMVRDGKTEDDEIRDKIDRIMTDVSGLRQKIPQCSDEVLEIVGLLSTMREKV